MTSYMTQTLNAPIILVDLILTRFLQVKMNYQQLPDN